MRITQDAIKHFIYKNKKEISETRNDLLAMLDSLIPSVGDIEINISGINPGTKYVGTRWEIWGSGRVPVGINASDTDFNIPEKTGGAKTHTLTTAQLPAHAHQVGQHAHGLNSHTHIIDGKTVTSAAETQEHTHNFDVNTGVTNKSLTGTFKAMQWHTGTASGIISQATNKVDRAADSGTQMGHNTFTVDVTHHHNVKGTTTGRSATHNHSVTIPQTTSGAASGSTANSAAFNTGNTGNGNAHNNLQPYITCYMWKRVA